MKQSNEAGGAGRWQLPLIVIDFEATALTLQSYPIEVGVARLDRTGGELACWSTLIAPDPAWNMTDQWDPDAQRVHGISRWQLRGGMAPAAAMAALDEWIGPCATVWCDGGLYDAHWLQTLAAAAGITPRFSLHDLDTWLRESPSLAAAYQRELSASSRPHRAGPDAVRMCLALSALISC
jgi:hypothetical protein